jgi:general stress protein 26
MERSRIQEPDDGRSVVRLRQMIGKVKVAMLTTLTGERQMRSRPLHTERVDEDGTLWFIVKRSAPKVEEILTHGGEVCVSYTDLDNQNFVSLSGTAQVVDNPQMKASLWSVTAEIWFPNGKEDASICVLKIVPERGEYWDGPATAAGRLFAFAQARLTGDTSGYGTQRKFTIS